MELRFLLWSVILLTLLKPAVSFIKPKCRGVWTEWGRWDNSGCSRDCSGSRTRSRECVNNGLFYCGEPNCSGSREQSERCGGKRSNGKWGEWSTPECRYCGQKRLKSRQCDNPAPSCGGRRCRGRSWMVVRCGQQGCPALEGNLVVDQSQESSHTCGATVTLSCPACHRLTGPSKLTCLPSGAWSRTPPRCDPMDGIQVRYKAQWTPFGPWDDRCKVCNQVISRQRTCQSVCGEVCQGEPEESYICGNSGCSINAFVHRSSELIASQHQAQCGEHVSLRCRSASKSLQGSAELQCGLDGWQGPLPECVDESCAAIPEFPHGTVMSTGLTYGKFSHFSCDAGYSLQGQQYLVCLGKTWSYSFPRCVEETVRCPILMLPEHVFSNTSSTEQGTAVMLMCEEGYRPESGPESTTNISCLDSGQWSGRVPVCIKITCPLLPEIDHSVVVHSDSGRKVEVECDAGYTLHGAGVLHCGDDGTWDHPVPLCNITECVLPKEQHGQWYRVTRTSLSLLRCNSGYIPRGPTEILCNSEGEWEGEVGRCVLQTCPELDTVPHGSVSSEDTVTGTIVTITCNEGYVSSGHWKLTCLSSGMWDYPLPSCTLTQCDSLPGIENGYVSSQSSDQGSEVEVVCEKGYRLVGHSHLRCTKNGSWSSEMPVCVLYGCVAPSFPNGLVGSEIIPLMASVTLACHTGYKLQGPTTAPCLSTGELQMSPLSQCVPITCPLFSVHHGDVTFDDVMYGSMARVRCNHGYRATVERVECGLSGRWSGVVECQKITCPDHPVPYKGYVEGDSYEVGATAQLVCEIGFIPRDISIINCTGQGAWKGSDLLECLPNGCPTLKHPQYGMFINQNNGTVSLICDSGYKAVGPASITCTNTTWTPSSHPHCVLDVECHVLTSPFAGVLSSNHTEYGALVSVTCNDGHVPSHSTPILCTRWGVWNGTLPSCSFPDCPAIARRGNGITLTGTKLGDTATLSCGTCEKSTGNRQSVCGNRGVWEPPIGGCQAVTCNTKINRKLYESVEGSIPTRCGDSVTFLCRPGYTTIGRTTITCYDTEQYDYHVPFCVESGIFRVRRQKKRRRLMTSLDDDMTSLDGDMTSVDGEMTPQDAEAELASLYADVTALDAKKKRRLMTSLDDEMTSQEADAELAALIYAEMTSLDDDSGS